MYITLIFSLNFIFFYYILLFYILFYNHDILVFFPRVVSRPAFQGFSASGDAVPWKLWPSADLPSTLHLVLAQHLRKGWRLWLLPSSTRALIETPWSIILFQKIDFQKACCAAYDFFWTVHFVFFNVIFHFSLLLQVLRNRNIIPRQAATRVLEVSPCSDGLGDAVAIRSQASGGTPTGGSVADQAPYIMICMGSYMETIPSVVNISGAEWNV